MSKISITPNQSGTGVFTIASPATNTDRTLTLPDEAGTVLTSASINVAQKGVPIFLARRNPLDTAQSLTSGVSTKAEFTEIVYDTHGGWDGANYWWTAPVAGYYLFTCGAHIGGVHDREQIQLTRNDSVSAYDYNVNAKVPFNQSHASINADPIVGGSGIIYMNGTTHYLWLELYMEGSSLTMRSTNSYLEGVLLRADT